VARIQGAPYHQILAMRLVIMMVSVWTRKGDQGRDRRPKGSGRIREPAGRQTRNLTPMLPCHSHNVMPAVAGPAAPAAHELPVLEIAVVVVVGATAATVAPSLARAPLARWPLPLDGR
jgi:hypothetical protein